MATIREYLNNNLLKLTGDKECNADDFYNYYLSANDIEKTSLLSYFVINNNPFAFKDKPLIFENLRQYLGRSLAVPLENVKLIGSAKTGFTISSDEYGRPYSYSGRDLDFLVVSEQLFELISNEFSLFQKLYRNNLITPRNNIEEKYWQENSYLVAKNVKRGFIDTRKIPNFNLFEKSQSINNMLSRIPRELKTVSKINAKSASIRIYKSWESCYSQLRLNTTRTLSNIQKILNQ